MSFTAPDPRVAFLPPLVVDRSAQPTLGQKSERPLSLHAAPAAATAPTVALDKLLRVHQNRRPAPAGFRGPSGHGPRAVELPDRRAPGAPHAGPGSRPRIRSGRGHRAAGQRRGRGGGGSSTRKSGRAPRPRGGRRRRRHRHCHLARPLGAGRGPLPKPREPSAGRRGQGGRDPQGGAALHAASGRARAGPRGAGPPPGPRRGLRPGRPLLGRPSPPGRAPRGLPRLPLLHDAGHDQGQHGERREPPRARCPPPGLGLRRGSGPRARQGRSVRGGPTRTIPARGQPPHRPHSFVLSWPTSTLAMALICPSWRGHISPDKHV